MRILVSSYLFYPSIGGVQSVSDTLARAFTALGHEVRLVTDTPAGGDSRSYPFQVVRRPRARDLLALVRWADVVYHNGISLRHSWPQLLARRPWVVTLATWPEATLFGPGMRPRLVRWLLRMAEVVAISDAVAREAGCCRMVIPNPYDDETFYREAEAARSEDVLFLGRLDKGKGVETLLRAIARLARDGIRVPATLVGEGPLEPALRREASELGLGDLVSFAGPKSGKDLRAALNAHRVLVVPSEFVEPFGVVALEGIACGCFVIGSEGGGLTDAIGRCGVTFPNGDHEALARRLGECLSNPALTAVPQTVVQGHLERHLPRTIAEQYVRLFEELLGQRSSARR